ncbi:hypothetical protein EZS27_039060, partial [termite gut metagenome]
AQIVENGRLRVESGVGEGVSP